jgi:hypothetical protein
MTSDGGLTAEVSRVDHGSLADIDDPGRLKAGELLLEHLSPVSVLVSRDVADNEEILEAFGLGVDPMARS